MKNTQERRNSARGGGMHAQMGKLRLREFQQLQNPVYGSGGRACH